MTASTNLREVVNARRLLGRDASIEKDKAHIRKFLASNEHYFRRTMEEVKGSADGWRFDEQLTAILDDHDLIARAASAEYPEEVQG